MSEEKNEALEASKTYQSKVEDSMDYIERFDILETINNVGNDEVFTPVRTCQMILDILPDEVWHNPDYKWLNPCDKNGVFLREIAIRLDKGLKDVPGYEDDEVRRKHIMTEMLYSIGLTKFTALVSRRTNYYCSVANRKPDGDIDKDGHYKNGYSIGYGEWFDTEEGNILSPITEHDFVRGKCKYCGTAEAGRYTDPTQNEHYAYEFIHVNHLNLERHLQDRFFKGDRNMKFDIVIGNPPYQLSDGGAQASATPIYNLFVDQAKSLNPKYICMIIKSNWMSGGRNLDDFRESMISDHRFRKLVDYINARDCFPSNEIKGGVDYFLWDRDYNSKCDITTHYADGYIETTNRFLKEEDMNVFVRYGQLLDIYSKCSDAEPFSKIISQEKPYGLRGDVFKQPEKHGLPQFQEEQFENSLKVYGLEGKERVVRYISRDCPKITNTRNDIDSWKVFLPRTNGTGILGERLGTPIIGEPGSICTETFLAVGKFKTQQEAKNCVTYIKTKFFRILLGAKKLTQDNSPDKFDLIPNQDFNEVWTDEKLYAKYGLSNEDIKFVEKYGEVMN